MKTKVKIENVSVNKTTHNHGLVESKLQSLVDYVDSSWDICTELYELTGDSIFLRMALLYEDFEDFLYKLSIKTI